MLFLGYSSFLNFPEGNCLEKTNGDSLVWIIGPYIFLLEFNQYLLNTPFDPFQDLKSQSESSGDVQVLVFRSDPTGSRYGHLSYHQILNKLGRILPSSLQKTLVFSDYLSLTPLSVPESSML